MGDLRAGDDCWDKATSSSRDVTANHQLLISLAVMIADLRAVYYLVSAVVSQGWGTYMIVLRLTFEAIVN